MGEALRIAGQLWLLMLASALMGVTFSALQGGAAWLRIGLSALVAAGVLLAFALEGKNRGMRALAAQRYAQRLREKGLDASAHEGSGYAPRYAIAGCALAFAAPIVLAAYVALCVPPRVGDATTGADWLRALARLMALPYINLFEDPAASVKLIDRLCVLWIALHPAAYIVGYLCAPAADRRLQKRILKAQRAAVRRERRGDLAATLTGDVRAPHYGHRPQSEQPRRKEPR